MKTIIVATDFSPVSVNAATYAVALAKDIDARVMLFNVYNIPVVIGDVPIALVTIDDLKKESERKLEDLKKKLELSAPGKLDLTCESRLGDTVDELEKFCGEVRPDIVVMGTKGKTGFEKAIFGSTTLTAIRHLKWPVLAIPPARKYEGGIKKIGFACDFREVASTTPVGNIKAMKKLFSAELHILNVDYKDRHFKPGTPEKLFYLHSVFDDVNPQYHFINNPDVEDGILEFAQANKMDLIIAIPKKHHLLEGLFKPSSTKQLVFQSFIPLMCIHE